MDANNKKISYPCVWEYTLIGKAEEQLKEAVKAVLPIHTPALKASKKSSNGKYLSFSFSVCVSSEEERDELFSQLKSQAAVTMVL